VRKPHICDTCSHIDRSEFFTNLLACLCEVEKKIFLLLSKS
jgi:hypothetical protein